MFTVITKVRLCVIHSSVDGVMPTVQSFKNIFLLYTATGLKASLVWRSPVTHEVIRMRTFSYKLVKVISAIIVCSIVDRVTTQSTGKQVVILHS